MILKFPDKISRVNNKKKIIIFYFDLRFFDALWKFAKAKEYFVEFYNVKKPSIHSMYKNDNRLIEHCDPKTALKFK